MIMPASTPCEPKMSKRSSHLTAYINRSASNPLDQRSRARKPRYRQSSSESFVNCNFRFLCLRPSDSDIVDWDLVACVIIPITDQPKCPICLDSPIAPKVTQCGHYFCWSCLLRYLVVSTPDPCPGQSKNWRVCPVCSDLFHQKKVKSVIFYESRPLTINHAFSFTLLKRPCSSVQSAECLHDSYFPSPFHKVTVISEHDLSDMVTQPERASLVDRLSSIDDPAELHFIELALSTEAEHRTVACNLDSHARQVSRDSFYFHQSSDGQYIFLDSLTIKILKAHFKDYSKLPASLTAPVRAIDDRIMNDYEAKRFRYLSDYVPMGANFMLCELDLAGVVDDAVLAIFGREIQIRNNARRRRAIREDMESRSAARRSSLDEGYGQFLRTEESDLRASYQDDFENFPLPPGSDATLGEKTAVWYSQPHDSDHGLMFNLSLEDLATSPQSSSPPSSVQEKKKGKKYILIGGTRHQSK